MGEVTTHMATAKCNTIVACANTMPTCLDAAKELEIPMSRVFQFELPEGYLQDSKPADGIKTIGSLIELGSELPPIEALKWDEGQSKTQVAYLCSTSGTSGRQVSRPSYLLRRSLGQMHGLTQRSETRNAHPLRADNQHRTNNNIRRLR